MAWARLSLRLTAPWNRTGVEETLSKKAKAPGTEQRPPEFVEALARGLSIIESFGAGSSDMTLSEVASKVKLSPAAVRRSLITLQALGYVGQTGKRFHLKPKILSLGSAFYFSARIDELMQPELRGFVEIYGDASSVATLDGMDVIYVAHYSVQRARRPSAVVGARYPAYATSTGRVLLAGLGPSALERYFEAVEPRALTALTVASKQDLRRVLQEVAKQGYATTVDQLDYGITALAVPITDFEGRVVAALNSSGYTGRLTPEGIIAERLEALRTCAARISQTLERYPVVASLLRPPLEPA